MQPCVTSSAAAASSVCMHHPVFDSVARTMSCTHVVQSQLFLAHTTFAIWDIIFRDKSSGLQVQLDQAQVVCQNPKIGTSREMPVFQNPKIGTFPESENRHIFQNPKIGTFLQVFGSQGLVAL